MMRISRPALVLSLAAAAACAGCVSETQKKIDSLRSNPTPQECAKHLSDPDPVVRLVATVTLETKCAASRDGLKGLIEAMSDRHPIVRIAAITAVRRLDPGAAKAAVPYLVDRIADRSADVRIAAIGALGRLAEGDLEVAAVLGRMALDVEEYYPVRIEAVLSLSLNASKSGFAVAEIAERLDRNFGKSDSIMSLCSTFLSLRSGGDQDRLLRILTKQLSDGRPLGKSLAARMLGIMGPAAKSAVPDLLKALEDPDETVKTSACSALGEVNSAPAQVIPALLKIVASETTLSLETSLAAARAVVDFGAQSVSYLLKGIESLDSRDRFWAVFMLGDIGPKARTAVPAIRRLLQSPYEDRDVLMAADIAINRIAGNGSGS